MKWRYIAVAAIILAAAGVYGYVRSTRHVDLPDKLTLYSLDPMPRQPGWKSKAGEEFHGYRVLGKIEVVDPDKRRELMAALLGGMRLHVDASTECFNPRHGLRAVAGSRTVDYVICFECRNVEIIDGAETSWAHTTSAPQPVFDRQLSDAGIPLAPSSGAKK